MSILKIKAKKSGGKAFWSAFLTEVPRRLPQST
jgi:hypothetical protein